MAINPKEIHGYQELYKALVNWEVEEARALLNNNKELIHASYDYLELIEHWDSDLYRPSRKIKCTPLYIACSVGDPEIVEMLIHSYGADVNLPSIFGDTPLHAATRNSHIEIIRILYHAGADVNQPGKDGITPLLNAVYARDLPTVEALLNYGAAPGIGGASLPLGLAAWYGFTEIIQVLLAAGADPNQIDSRGYPSLRSAIMRGSLEIINILLAAGADPNAVDNDGMASLHWALLNIFYDERVKIVEMLLNAGADLDKLNHEGETPQQMLQARPGSPEAKWQMNEVLTHYPQVAAMKQEWRRYRYAEDNSAGFFSHSQWAPEEVMDDIYALVLKAKLRAC